MDNRIKSAARHPAISEGGAPLSTPDGVKSLAGILARAAHGSGSRGLTFVGDAGAARFLSYRELYSEALRIASGLRRARVGGGQPVVLQLANSSDFIPAFWGTLLAGGVAVPLGVPPDYDPRQRNAQRLVDAHRVLGSPIALVADASQASGLHRLGFGRVEALNELKSDADDLPTASPGPGESAVLMHTSGTTGPPNLVQLSHLNLLSSASGIAVANGLSADDVSLTWLPLFQISGLLRMIRDVCLGASQVHASTQPILSNPVKWLDLIQRFRITSSWAPNFAFALLAEQETSIRSGRWNLSSLRSLLWLGEMASRGTVNRILRLLTPHGMSPRALHASWGMTELGGSATFTDRCAEQLAEVGVEFLECGKPIAGLSLRIVDGADQVLEEGEVGRVQARGAIVTRGYLGEDQEGDSPFTEDGWLKTGDLGFLRGGALTVVGREKQVIIVNGVNYNPHEIEAAIEDIDGIVPGYSAACGIAGDDTERLAIFFGTTAPDDRALTEVLRRVRQVVTQRTGLRPAHLVPLGGDAFPRTPGGKIQRRELQQRFYAGDFHNIVQHVEGLLGGTISDGHAISAPTERSVLQKVVDVAAKVLKSNVGPDDNFFAAGGGSLQVLQLVAALDQAFPGSRLTTTQVFRHPRLSDLAGRILQRQSPNAPKIARASSGEHRPPRSPPGPCDVAIIGMACRFPQANDIDEFWKNLVEGKESIRRLSDDELLGSGVDPALLARPEYVRAAAVIEGIELFDADFFGYSAREAALVDPQQRIFLECCSAVLEDAGYTPEAAGGSIGVFAGARISEYLMFHQRPADLAGLGVGSGSSLTDYLTHLGNDKDFLATRTSFKLGLKGPSLSVQTACSTSLVAVHLACQSLLAGECELAVAGGVTLRIPQAAGHLYSEGLIFSRDGHTRAFDAKAGGTLFGSGAGAVLLKPLSRAQEDGDHIYAVIKGSAINNDGDAKANYTAPSVEGQREVIRAAQERASISAETVTYVEAHGTGTLLGDPIEIAALTEAFNLPPDRGPTCAVGSVKTNLGHLIQAAGIAGLIKTALMLHNRTLVPSLNFDEPNPHIAFGRTPFYVNTSVKPWDSAVGPRRAGVSSFGFGGTNAHVVLEEAPPVLRPNQASTKERACHILCLSGKSHGALRAQVSQFRAFLEGGSTESLANICFTANVGRSHFAHRFVAIAESAPEMAQRLREVEASLTADDVTPAKRTHPAPKVAFLFTGQGSQHVGMGKELFETQPRFRSSMERCDQLSREWLDRPLLSLLYDGSADAPRLLDQAHHTQVALYAIEVSLAALWRSWGIEPTAVLGHSVGEYAAAQVAGLISLEEGLRLVATRGSLMHGLPHHGEMVTVFCDEGRVRAAIERHPGVVSVAAVNAPRNVVISGDGEAVRAVAQSLAEEGVDCKTLRVSQAYHSELIAPMLDGFERAISAVKFNEARTPFVSSLTGRLASTEELSAPGYWSRQTRDTVRFAEAMKTIGEIECDVFVEIGPRPALLTLGQLALEADGALDDRLWLASLPKAEVGGGGDWRQILQSLGKLHARGAAIHWGELDAPYPRRRVRIPTYPFQRQRCWSEPTFRTGPRATGVVLPHPLLSRRIHSPIPIFETQLSTEKFPYLLDHRVYGRAILPATAYLELANAAAREVNGGQPSVLTGVQFRAPLVLSETSTTAVQVVLSTAGDRTEFKICSERSAAAKEWTLHATGDIGGACAKPGGGQNERLAEIQKRCGRKIDLEEYHANLAKRGNTFGPSFLGLRRLWTADTEALGEVQLPDGLGPERYWLHPALLDACLRVVSGLGTTDWEAAYLPMQIDRVELCGSSLSHVWCHAVLHQDATGGAEARMADLSLFDGGGALVGRLVGLLSKRAPRGNLFRDALPRLYAIHWKPMPVPPKSTAPGEGRWLILGDGQLSTALTSSLGEGALAVGSVDRRGLERALALADGNAIGLVGAISVFEEEDEAGASPADLAHRWARQALDQVQALIPWIAGRPFQLVWVVRGTGERGRAGEGPSLAASPLLGFGRVLRQEHPEVQQKMVALDPTAGDLATTAQVLLAEIAAADPEPEIAYHDGRRLAPRLVDAARTSDQRLAVPDAPSYGLCVRSPGLIENLRIEARDRRSPGIGEVEIEVEASGLNFRDVLIALDEYPGGGEMGSECSGRITAVGPQVDRLRVGDSVIARASGSFSRFVTVDARHVVRCPPDLSLADAATVPQSFLTAQYGLFDLGQLEKGSRVLIHAAAGGVGLAAVQLARRAGAEIFATASPAKWETLEAQGVHHVGSSRTLDFASQFKRALGGSRLDIVLNSLTGRFIDESMALLAPGGRFIEMGKRDLRDPKAVATQFPQLTYRPFELAEVPAPRVEAMLAEIAEGFGRGELSPLPKRTFPISCAPAAFRFMAEAKHVGKVVLLPARRSALVRPDATYLITGGLGALGLETARWLAGKGARHLVLLGRREPTEPARDVIRELGALGASVAVTLGDVADPAQLKLALDAIPSSVPLRGVIHAAGVLDDGLIREQNPERFSRVMHSKVEGAWNLHQLTSKLTLDFFVLFSSRAALLGSAGQSNYAAANAFLDALASAREAEGLPGLSVAWGAWSGEGMAARSDSTTRQHLESQGWGSLHPQEATALLEQALSQGTPYVGAFPFEVEKFRVASGGHVPPLLSELVAPMRGEPSTPDLFVHLRELKVERREAELQAVLQAEVANILGLASSQEAPLARPLRELGMDSLMAVELRNRIAKRLGRPVPATLVFDHPTIRQQARYLLTQLFSLVEETPRPAVPNPPASPVDADLTQLSDEELISRLKSVATRAAKK